MSQGEHTLPVRPSEARFGMGCRRRDRRREEDMLLRREQSANTQWLQNRPACDLPTAGN